MLLPILVPMMNYPQSLHQRIRNSTKWMSLWRAKGLSHFSELKSFKEKDIQDIAESFSKRTANDGRYLFGIRRTRLLIGLIHWVQDFARVGENPNIYQYIGEADHFRTALQVALDRADVRKIELEQSDTVSKKAADPGKFKDIRKWPEREPSFVNYLSTIQGVNDVPLLYVVREQAVPEADAVYQSFNEKAIASAPLQSPMFQAVARKVHQLLKSFLQS